MGNDTKTASEIFKVSQRTIQRWSKKKKETGNIAPRRRAFAYRKFDLEQLKQYVELHPYEFLYEIAEKFSVNYKLFFMLSKS